MSKNKKISREDLPEFIGQILDGFEDFLKEKGVEIPNSERNEATAFGEDPDDIAILYGSDYGDLYDYIEETLVNWGVVEE